MSALVSRNEAEIRTKSPLRLWLGPRWFDPIARELRAADGTSINLRRQPIDVLAYLAERHGKIVAKEELVSDIWSDVAVTDDSLVQCIGDIRRALGPEARDCVQTVRRRGYRLVSSGHEPDVDDPSEPHSSWRTPRALATVLGAPLGLAAIMVYYQPDNRIGPEASKGPTRPVIAVLPFSNHEEDPTQQYFVDGLTEDIATDLSRVSALSIISSASTFAMRDVERTPVKLTGEFVRRHIDWDIRAVRVLQALARLCD